MTSEQLHQWLRMRHPKAYSHHCFHDDAGVMGRCSVFYGRYEFHLYNRWSGETIWHQTVWIDQRGYPLLVKEWRYHVAEFVKRILKSDVEGVQGERAVDERLAADHPALHEHLTIDWLDGKKREVSTLGISCDGGRWKARLADRDNGLVCFVTGDGFYAVLDALERQVANGTADWRVDQFAKPARQRGK